MVNETSIQFTMDLGSGGILAGYAIDGVDNDEDGVEDDPAKSNTQDTDGDGYIDDMEAVEESRIGDGDVTDDGEKIKYFLQANGATNDLIRGIWNNAAGSYNTQTVITNVEWLDFVYRDEDDNVLPQKPLVECPAGSGFNSLNLDLTEIDKVEITLVVRTTNEDYRYTDTGTYSNLDGSRSFDPTPDDNFRRRAFTMVVQIRNNI